MVLVAILTVLIGAVLAQRFRVLFLVPTALAGWLLTVIIGVTSGFEAWTIVWAGLLGSAGIQFGYLAAIAISEIDRRRLAQARRRGFAASH